MKETIPPIIQAPELLKLRDAGDLVIVDASSGKNANADSNAASKYLEGAVFIDLETQLAEINADPSNGGRHPLPQIENFARTLASLGISRESHVVIYDDKHGSNAAARFWWMLKSIGHEKAQVLNGGIQEAEKAGFPVSSTTKPVVDHAEPYDVDGWKLRIAERDEVEKSSRSDRHLVIDVRDAVRYKGEYEPIDLIAGHIPGAINVPFTENLDQHGLFLSPAELKMKYERILGSIKSENTIVHCGSGVTACHSLLAMAYAGLEIPKLYVGSWSEWSRNMS